MIITFYNYYLFFSYQLNCFNQNIIYNFLPFYIRLTQNFG